MKGWLGANPNQKPAPCSHVTWSTSVPNWLPEALLSSRAQHPLCEHSTLSASTAPSLRGCIHPPRPRAPPVSHLWFKAPERGPPRQTQIGRVHKTPRQYPQGTRTWPTARFSFRSMGPECCRHAQVSVVTPERKAPPQHVQTRGLCHSHSICGGRREGERDHIRPGCRSRWPL